MRRIIQGGIKLKYLSQTGYFPSGNSRLYCRPPNAKAVAMPDLKGNEPDFLKAYVAVTGSAPKVERKPFGAGTIGEGITAYLGSSTFLSLVPGTRERYRLRCDEFRAKYGTAQVDDLSARHIKYDLSKFEGHSSNNRLKVWRSIFKFWDEQGIVEINVALQVSVKKTAKTDGHIPWTRQDFADFRAFWPVGSMQRLAFELMYRTCAAIGDTSRLSRAMVSNDGWLTYTRQKSKSTAVCPFYDDGPDWFEATDDLQACLDAAPLHVIFLTTQHGKPKSAKSASQWFSKAATDAGLGVDKTAHGIRKGRAAMFKENGATSDQRMAVLGHETEAEAAHYSKSADLKKIIGGTEKFQLSAQVPTFETKSLIIKGNRNA